MWLDERAPAIPPLRPSWVWKDHDPDEHLEGPTRLRDDIHQFFLFDYASLNFEAVRALLRI